MLQVVAEAGTDTSALQILSELASSFSSLGVDLVVLELQLDRSQSRQSLGLQLCRQLKKQYPNLPVLLLTALQDTRALAAAKQAGVNGYCPKGIPVTELVAVMRQVATGGSGFTSATRHSPLVRFRNHLRLSGLQQIDASLAEVTAQLQGLTNC